MIALPAVMCEDVSSVTDSIGWMRDGMDFVDVVFSALRKAFSAAASTDHVVMRSPSLTPVQYDLTVAGRYLSDRLPNTRMVYTNAARPAHRRGGVCPSGLSPLAPCVCHDYANEYESTVGPARSEAGEWESKDLITRQP